MRVGESYRYCGRSCQRFPARAKGQNPEEVVGVNQTYTCDMLFPFEFASNAIILFTL